MKGESWNVYIFKSVQGLSLNVLVIVVYKVKIFKIFAMFWFYIVVRIAWKWEKAGRKGYQGVIQLL